MTIKKITLNKIREISYFSDKSATFFWDKNFHFWENKFRKNTIKELRENNLTQIQPHGQPLGFIFGWRSLNFLWAMVKPFEKGKKIKKFCYDKNKIRQISYFLKGWKWTFLVLFFKCVFFHVGRKNKILNKYPLHDIGKRAFCARFCTTLLCTLQKWTRINVQNAKVVNKVAQKRANVHTLFFIIFYYFSINKLLLLC